ncbi:MAG: pantoate--beta-alanine ligase [Campylobacter sputorum]|uniref:pantoate--beta-alanine ligase n=1 Tax=Campylobacter sputorum TaxID=206 RepID=UPI000B76F69B|nr:pantoate--beta-alanine ligase [Campylobacter sputorum]ASM37145.1 pantothenate synthetase [Campylobacter sputorum bv. faecalis CCUG 20703]ASM38816.1 pantothenate synthetase [Campylobacter sputorum bv. paraureolyticus LMG 11764]MDY6120532.1 pantoate--beta-alanine ligase [Campylobacter sputorum]
MIVIKTIKELQEFLETSSRNIGLVPTMGALHDGHVSLIKKCVSENEVSIVSIFVNPAQFLPEEDFDKYPKKEEADIKICEMLGVSVVFMPNKNEMYFENEPLIKAPEHLSTILEGKTRPGHFDGVLRVLNKFFNLIKPKNAYFGKKDTQQLIIVQNMVKSFFMGINIIPCDIIRANDGLALSSRNTYLNDDELCMALKLSRSLVKATNLIQQGELNSQNIKTQMLQILEPLKVDYVAITDKNLAEVQKIELGNTIILVAVYIGQTRLIDNIWL